MFSNRISKGRLLALVAALLLVLTVIPPLSAPVGASGYRMDSDLKDSQASFWGEAAYDNSGYPVVSGGDVNGDGYDDFLIGVFENSEGGSYAGQTYLILGKASGWAMDTNLSKADASFWGENVDDYSGSAAAIVGDVNGDGFDDILIGATGNSDGGSYTGQTYLIFGKASGWAMDTSLSKADASFWGENVNDWSGNVVSGAGDVNRDGYADFLIASASNSEAADGAGQTYLIFGKASGWAMDTSLSKADASFLGENMQDYSGSMVAPAGDVNGDGYGDFLISTYANSDGGDYAGQTYLIFGKASGWAMDTSLSKADASFWGENAYDMAGTTLAGGGDVNGDGYDDILIGATGNSEGGFLAGQTYLILGKASGWAQDTVLSNADASFWGEAPNDYAGASIADAGDMNGDGYDDILIGANQNGEPGYGAGQTYLILGKASGWAQDTVLSKADASFWGEEIGDASGVYVATGDVNGDGYDDILIGAITNMEGGVVAGQTYLIFFDSAPTAPSNFHSKLKGDGKAIDLSWDTVPYWKDITGYDIYRSSDGSSYKMIAQVNGTTLSYNDTKVDLGRTYYYKVTATSFPKLVSPFSDTIEVFNDIDTDLDNIGNALDTDDDGDGVPDASDAFPLDPNEWLDTDLDGIGNNADTDDDNDGILDAMDAAPLNPLNGIQSDIALISTTLQEVQGTVNDIKVDMALMDGNLTALSTNVTAMNNSLSTHIKGLATDISGLNLTLQSEIDALGSGVKTDIAGLNRTLKSLNTSLHAELTAMEAEDQAFQGETATTLQEILDQLDTLDMNMTKNIKDLQTTLNNLNSTTLAQMEQQLTAIENKIDASGKASSNDTKSVLEKISALKTDIGQFRSDTSTRLNNITDLLAQLDNLTLMAQNIKSIQQDTAAMKAELARLNDIENSIKEIKKEQAKTTNKVEGTGGLNMAMVALLVIILVVAIVLLFVGRKSSGTSAPVTVEEEPVKRHTKSNKPKKTEETEVEEAEEEEEA